MIEGGGGRGEASFPSQRSASAAKRVPERRRGGEVRVDELSTPSILCSSPFPL